MSEPVIDGFAGPGGWDLAARALGLDPLGIEWDDAACATRAAAGLRTRQADIAKLDPMEFAPVRLAIFSPPCQAFSMAGAGAGRRALEAYAAAIRAMAEGRELDVAALDEACGDPRGHLVLEPLRWALALRPEMIACEQVEPVLPLWEEMAVALRSVGYMTWTGVLSAERYGVPQTRRRAFLLASLTRQPREPEATHARYVPPRAKARQEESLFDAPEPQRIVLPEDRGLLPWRSMAEALGWGMNARPYPVLACSSDTGGPDLEKVGGSGARALLYEEQEAGRWEGEFEDFGHLTTSGRRRDGRWTYRNGTHDHAAERDQDEPAPTVTLRANNQPNASVRGADEPAPTIAAGHSTADRVWVVQTNNFSAVARDPDGGRSKDGSVPYTRPVDAPATTICGSNPGVMNPNGGGAEVSMSERGYIPWSKEKGDAAAAIRVDVAEAAVLQDFPADYPWQGTRTAKYRQIGDAVPPGLAFAALLELLHADR